MNIFILDEDIVLCARYHVDKHVVKMILETTQLLNNAYIKHNANLKPIYRETHKSHPCSLWASETSSNFEWLVALGMELCKEYSYRYGKVHKCQDILSYFSDRGFNLPVGGLTKFVQCMPGQYHSDNAVISYRNYYKFEKHLLAKWTKREVPIWWNEI